jgi:hypothetical protein
MPISTEVIQAQGLDVAAHVEWHVRGLCTRVKAWGDAEWSQVLTMFIRETEAETSDFYEPGVNPSDWTGTDRGAVFVAALKCATTWTGWTPALPPFPWKSDADALTRAGAIIVALKAEHGAAWLTYVSSDGRQIIGDKPGLLPAVTIAYTGASKPSREKSSAPVSEPVA